MVNIRQLKTKIMELEDYNKILIGKEVALKKQMEKIFQFYFELIPDDNTLRGNSLNGCRTPKLSTAIDYIIRTYKKTIKGL